MRESQTHTEGQPTNHVISPWPDGFPKLAELYDEASVSTSKEQLLELPAFVSCYPDVLRKIEKDFSYLSLKSWSIFKKKLIPLVKNATRAQCFDILNELQAHRYLREHEYLDTQLSG